MLEAGFEYLMTADKNLKNQQNLDKYPVKLIVIKTFDNRYKTLVQFVTRIEEVILSADREAKIIEIDLRLG
jgi:hypothetical protein